jgi:nitrogenase molybdenum-iron protein alpha/beta subunit
MSKLCVTLPPFSPDYSGVCSALFELGGLVIIHDASGCTGNYTGFDEPRWYGSTSLVFCSNLRELDAVMGDDERLIQKALAAAGDLNPRFIAVLGSPVPMVTGTDMPGIASEIEARSGVPSFGFATTGLRYYDKGVGDALLAVAKRFVEPPREKRPGSVNLLGLTPLDYSANGNASDLRECLEEAGWDVIASFAMGSGLDEIAQSAEASLNVVASVSGLPLARHFRDAYGIPFICGVPIGDAWRKSELGGAREAAETRDDGIQRGPSALIMHEQIIANSLRECLRADYGISSVTVATPFALSREIAQNGDENPATEAEIRRLLNRGFDFIFADPLFRELLSTAETNFVDLPHVAVSSKLCWDNYVKIAGGRIHGYLAAAGLWKGLM